MVHAAPAEPGRHFNESGCETAEVVKVSSETVMRDWKLARVWLLTELNSGA
jgi:hypothetical protein